MFGKLEDIFGNHSFPKLSGLKVPEVMGSEEVGKNHATASVKGHVLGRGMQGAVAKE